MNERRILIGITGRARSGKDTVARHLEQRYELRSYSFAEPLKRGLREMFDLTEEHTDGALKETPVPWLGVSPRRLMQTLGTEWGRQIIRPDLWVMLAQQEWEWNLVRTMQSGHTYRGMIIPDIRFEDEAEFIRSNGGCLIHVTRPGQPKVEAHASENGVAFTAYDTRLVNDDTIDTLLMAADHVADAHINGAR